VQTDAGKAQPAFPVEIHTPPLTGKADGITLQTAEQHSDGDHQQQTINPLRTAQATALQLEDPGFLIAEQLLTAEALLVRPDQIQAGRKVADQIPGLSGRDANRPGQHQMSLVTSIPEPNSPKATAMAAGRAVLTEESDQLSMDPGMGIHEGLVCENPQDLMAPCPPNQLRPMPAQ
jgi:hypothetical protein